MKLKNSLINFDIYSLKALESIPEHLIRFDGSRRIPTIRQAIEETIEKGVKIHPPGFVYVEALPSLKDHLELPESLASKMWTICDNIEASHILTNRGLKRIDETTDDEVLVYLRKPMDGDIAVIIRHPSIHDKTMTTVRIKLTESKNTRIPQHLWSSIQGDFDGDHAVIGIVSSSLIEEKYKHREPDLKEIEIPKFEHIEIPKSWTSMRIRALMSTESEFIFINRICQFEFGIEGIEIAEILFEAWNNDKFGEAVEKLIEHLDEDKAREFEWLVRYYFKSKGAKLIGTIEKYIFDVLGNFEIEFVDKSLQEHFESGKWLEVFEKIQQSILDLKHHHTPLTNLDDAKKISRLANQPIRFDVIEKIMSKYNIDKKSIIVFYELAKLARNTKLRFLTYRPVEKVINGYVHKFVKWRIEELFDEIPDVEIPKKIVIETSGDIE